MGRYNRTDGRRGNKKCQENRNTYFLKHGYLELREKSPFEVRKDLFQEICEQLLELRSYPFQKLRKHFFQQLNHPFHHRYHSRNRAPEIKACTAHLKVRPFHAPRRSPFSAASSVMPYPFKASDNQRLFFRRGLGDHIRPVPTHANGELLHRLGEECHPRRLPVPVGRSTV